MKKKYPGNYIGLVLFVCMCKYLKGEVLQSFIKDSFSNGILRQRYIINYYKKADIQQMRVSPERPEDVCVYNYITYGDKLKMNDLLKKYYDLYVNISEVGAISRGEVLPDWIKKNLKKFFIV